MKALRLPTCNRYGRSPRAANRWKVSLPVGVGRGILFLERCYHLLKPKGTIAIILDEGVLSHPSAQDVRSFLIDRYNILGTPLLP